MSVATIANRYARALADVIVEKREVNEVAAELKQFAAMVEGHTQLDEVFASPVIAPERKRVVLNELLNRFKARQTVQNFLYLLLTNNRLHQLTPMVRALETELDGRMNIVTAEIVTAREINTDEQRLLHERLKAVTGKEVRLHYKTDPDIIGGVVTRIGSKVYDGSIKNQLAQMKERLMQ
jgi:F-type H+-transporting ATPase subunit delta